MKLIDVPSTPSMRRRMTRPTSGLSKTLREPSSIGSDKNPANLFVATFIGESNILEGIVRQRNGERAEVMLETGDVVSAHVIDDVRRNGAGILSIRPERIHIMPADASGLTGVPGRVLERLFLGDQIRLRLDVFNQNGFFVKLPSSSS